MSPPGPWGPAPPPPAAVLFDLFHTLLVPCTERLPRVEVAPGRSIPSTAPLLMPVLHRWNPALELQTAVAAIWDGWQRGEAIRRDERREIHAATRFAWVLETLGLGAPGRAEALVAAHRAALLEATEVPAARAAVVRALAARGPVGVITNYDDPEGARAVLDRAGLSDHLSVLVVSGAEGWVKPHPWLFERALIALKVPASQVWYVGDSWEHDVLGARAAGLRPVWFAAGGLGAEGAPDEATPIVSDLAQLKEWMP